MPDDTLHPDDAAAMREPLAGAHGELRQQLSNAVVALFKQYFGRGPTSCRTYLEPNLVMFVLAGGYTPAEQTLFEAGKWYEVRQARIAWQDSMEVRFIDTIERLTHRTVKAFLSANRQDAELTIELFVLEPDTARLTLTVSAPSDRSTSGARVGGPVRGGCLQGVGHR